jgi:hypothetical protein
MDRKSSSFATRAVSGIALLAIALIAATLTSSVRSDDADGATVSRHASAGHSVSAPIVVAQGRCFNGRCF